MLPPATLAGLIVSVLAVALIGLFTFRSLQTREEAVERVTHTLQVIEQLETLQSNTKDAETGQRGYLLTGEERYLEPYTTARTALPETFKTLRGLGLGLYIVHQIVQAHHGDVEVQSDDATVFRVTVPRSAAEVVKL